MKKNSRKGAALLYVVILLALVSIFAAGALVLSRHNMAMTASESSAEQAYFTAKSGLNSTIAAIKENPEETVGIASTMSVGTVKTLDVSGIDQDKYGSLQVKLTCKEMHETRTDVCGIIQVDSIGEYNNISRLASAIVEVTFLGGFDHPIMILNELNIDGRFENVSIYNFTDDLYEPIGGSNEIKAQILETAFKQNVSLDVDALKQHITSKAGSGVTNMENLSSCKNTINSSCSINVNLITNALNNETYNINNTNGDVVIYISPFWLGAWWGINSSNLILNISNTSNMVYIVFDGFSDINFKTGLQINYTGGQSAPDVSNVAIVNLSSSPLNFGQTSGRDYNINAWIINPLSTVSIYSQAKEIAIKGGLIADSLVLDGGNGNKPNNLVIEGVTPNASIMEMFSALTGVEGEEGTGAPAWEESYGKYE